MKVEMVVQVDLLERGEGTVKQEEVGITMEMVGVAVVILEGVQVVFVLIASVLEPGVHLLFQEIAPDWPNSAGICLRFWGYQKRCYTNIQRLPGIDQACLRRVLFALLFPPGCSADTRYDFWKSVFGIRGTGQCVFRNESACGGCTEEYLYSHGRRKVPVYQADEDAGPAIFCREILDGTFGKRFVLCGIVSHFSALVGLFRGKSGFIEFFPAFRSLRDRRIRPISNK